MKIIVNSIAAILIAVSLSGCIVIGGDHDREHWQKQQIENKRIISQLEINDSRDSVIDQLGAPDFSEAYSKGNDDYRILFYRTNHEHSDGETTKDETTPLIFRNDRLIGWGFEALERNR